MALPLLAVAAGKLLASGAAFGAGASVVEKGINMMNSNKEADTSNAEVAGQLAGGAAAAYGANKLMKGKTVLSTDKASKILGDATMKIDGDKQRVSMVDPKTGKVIAKPFKDVTVGELSKKSGGIAQKTPQGKLIAGLKSVSSKITPSNFKSLITRNPKIAAATALVGGGAVLYNYLKGDVTPEEALEIETKLSDENLSGAGSLNTEGNNNLETPLAKNTTIKNINNIVENSDIDTENLEATDDFEYHLEDTKLPSGMLPYEVAQELLGMNWNNVRDQLDEFVGTALGATGVSLDQFGPKSSAKRNIVIANVLAQLANNNPELIEELKHSLGGSEIEI